MDERMAANVFREHAEEILANWRACPYGARTIALIENDGRFAVYNGGLALSVEADLISGRSKALILAAPGQPGLPPHRPHFPATPSEVTAALLEKNIEYWTYLGETEEES